MAAREKGMRIVSVSREVCGLIRCWRSSSKSMARNHKKTKRVPRLRHLCCCSYNKKICRRKKWLNSFNRSSSRKTKKYRRLEVCFPRPRASISHLRQWALMDPMMARTSRMWQQKSSRVVEIIELAIGLTVWSNRASTFIGRNLAPKTSFRKINCAFSKTRWLGCPMLTLLILLIKW